ncbi:MAG: hypothetical protein EHM28_10975 [Spirochaetaceae bacterium]|nr:MAG: hypothetical protein EHM28_10975 [Spirochaetaceae bacterium]
MKNCFYIILAALLFTACSSVTDIYINSLSEEELKKIEDIEGAFLIYWNEDDPSQLDKIEKSISEMLATPILSKALKGKLLAMNAELYFYRGKQALSAEQLAISAQADPEGERLFLTKCIIEKDPATKIKILEEGYGKSESHTFIAVFLAELYFSQDNYKQAVAMYDEALRILPIRYRIYYQQNRDTAFQFMGQPAQPKDLTAITRVGVLNIEQTITTIIANTSYLDPVTSRKDIPAKELLISLYEHNYFQNSNLLLESPILRKDIAYLLLHVVVSLENDPILLTRAGEKYRDSGRRSPIADVAVSDYFFDAAFVLVEREIMELPDGTNFYPEKTLSGLDLMGILDRLRLRYRK